MVQRLPLRTRTTGKNRLWDLRPVTLYIAIIISGLVSGSVYALGGMGLVLTFKTSGIFNFAQGSQAAAGAYLMYEFWNRLGWPWPAALLTSLLVAGVVGGLLLERLAAALATVPTAARVVASVGLLLMIQGILVVIYGNATIPVPHFLPQHRLHLPGVYITVEELI